MDISIGVLILPPYQTKYEGGKYDFKQCDYRAIIAGSVKYHIQTVHDGVKYNCNQCDYRTITKDSFAIHIQAVHVGLGALIFFRKKSGQIVCPDVLGNNQCKMSLPRYFAIFC